MIASGERPLSHGRRRSTSEAHRLGAPTHLIANVAFDSVITAVPVAGNVADVFFRASRRNTRLLREWLATSQR